MDLFGAPLQPDPTIALSAPKTPPLIKAGPLHRIQFVIEFVGPRSVPASAASALLKSDWFAALGSPLLYSMRAIDRSWQPLTNSTDGSYDSLSACWWYFTDSGTLSGESAAQLFMTAERFAAQINRRCVPLPSPDLVNSAVEELAALREGLDVGFSLAFEPSSGWVSERDAWIQCSRLGLSFSPSGSFDWLPEGYASPLLSVTPIGTNDQFSLASVQAGARHAGLSVGFSIPRCPAPLEALQAAFHISEVLEQALGGRSYDESNKPLDATHRVQIREQLSQALSILETAKLPPGSLEALALFRS